MQLNSQGKSSQPHVVIVGAGFGGISAAKALRKAPVDVTIIDRRNYHLFQPLLYQVATADLSPADVAWPIRGIFSKQSNVSVVLSEVTNIDPFNHEVYGEHGVLRYDYLVVANGSSHSYFGNDQWEENAPGLKRITDATDIRKRVLVAFERAEVSKATAEQERQLTFVVVGGGPTGVEMAGAIAELSRFTLAEDFNRISPKDARVILIEAGDCLLKGFPESLSRKAKTSLEKLGVEVCLSRRVTDITEMGVTTDQGFLPAATTVWGAGVEVKDTGQWLGCETDRSGKVPVCEDMSLAKHRNVFVVGDAAKVGWKDDIDVPGIAPAAKQGGQYVAKVIEREVRGKDRGAAFRYRHRGNLATIGRHAAVISKGGLKLSGAIAWWIWGLAHIYFLIGVRKPIFVAMSWFWSYLTYSRGARLITGLRPRIKAKPDKDMSKLIGPVRDKVA